MTVSPTSYPVPGFEPWFEGPIEPHPTGGFTLAYRKTTLLDIEETHFVVVGRAEHFHRLDGPARIREGVDGEKVLDWWRTTPERTATRVHRVDGPATVRITPAGDSACRYTANVGGIVTRSYRRSEFFDELYATSHPDLLEAEFELTPFAPLLGEGIPLRTITDLLGAGVETPDGVRAVLEGAPMEWVRAFEGSGIAESVTRSM